MMQLLQCMALPIASGKEYILLSQPYRVTQHNVLCDNSRSIIHISIE